MCVFNTVEARVTILYTALKPALNVTAKDLFIRQCNLIKSAFVADTIVMGDFNLEYCKKHEVNYSNSNLFVLFDEILDDLNLIQLANFVTWSRMTGTFLRSSTLDHIYVNNIELVTITCTKSITFVDI